MALKSIYKELLEAVRPPQDSVEGMEMFSSFMDDMDDDIMSRYAKSESNLAYLPINRHFIEQNGLRFDISSINSCVIKDKLPKKVLDEYIDGKYFNDYPIAVSFLMRRDEYINMQRETISDGLYNILRFSRGMCNVFSQGHIVSVYGDSDTVTVIAGFSKEGEEFDD